MSSGTGERRVGPGWWFVALALALALAIATVIARTPRRADPFAFDVDISSSAAGRVQVYYDIGHGLREEDSAWRMVGASATRNRLRITLPEGTYRALRFDPIDRPATLTFSNPRIRTRSGALVRAIDPRELQPNDQVAAYRVTGRAATLVVAPAQNDPTLTLALPVPLELRFEWAQQLRGAAASVAGWFLLWVCVLLAISAAWRQRERLYRWRVRLPRTALAVIAIASGVLASYPVVFAGKSFVSPSNEALLRPVPPTVPGYTDTTKRDLHTPDPAALMWQDIPYSVVEYDALVRDHEWPLWDRYLSCGVTLLGQGQAMLGDPVQLLVIAARGASWAWDLKFVLAKILFAVGLTLTIWSFTHDFTAGAILAVAAPFVAFYNFRFEHPAIFSFSYAPWVLCAWAMIIRAESTRALRNGLIVWVVANVALLGSGTAKEAYMLSLAMNLCGVTTWLFTAAPAQVRKWRCACTIVAVILCTIAITVPLWLTFFNALGESFTVYDTPQVWQAPRMWIVGVFDSLFYVETNASHGHFLPSANLLIALGTVFALAQPWDRLRRAPHILVMTAGAVAAIALAHGFVPAAWIAATPVLRNIFHVHNVFDCVAVVLLCAIAGGGFHAARTTLGGPKPWRWPIVGAIGFAALLGFYFYDLRQFWGPGGTFAGWWQGAHAHAFFYFNLGLMLAACIVLAVLARRRLVAGRTPATAAVVAMISLVVLLYRHGMHVDFGFADSYLTFPMVRADLATPSPAIEAARADAHGQPFRMIGADDDLINGWNAVYDVESVNGPDAVMNRQYREFLAAAGLITNGDWRIRVSSSDFGLQKPLLDFLGVNYVISESSDIPASAGYTKVGSFDMELYRSAAAWPRAYFVNSITPFHDLPEFTRLVRSDAGRPFAAVQDGDLAAVPSGLRPTAGARTASSTITPARDFRLTANMTSFTVQAPAAGVVVLQETWLPHDFRLTVNGAPAPYLRVNYAFKGVIVPQAGEYHIRFEYWPEHLTLMLWISAAGIILLVVALVRLSLP